MLAKLAALSLPDVQVPGVLGVDWDVGRKGKGSRAESGVGGGGWATGAWLLMEWIEGRNVKDLLREWDRVRKGEDENEGEGPVDRASPDGDVRQLLRRVGKAVGALHSKGGVIHGDLTSSNIMVRPTTGEMANGFLNGAPKAQGVQELSLDGEIVLIDFGLATQSVQDEDRAVDLYVLERAFGSTHPSQEGWFKDEVLDSQEGYRGSFKGANVVLKRLEEVRMRGRKRSMVG